MAATPTAPWLPAPRATQNPRGRARPTKGFLARRLIAPCVCVLALVTGAWFGQAYTLFADLNSVGVSTPSVERAEATAWHFYDAIDALLRTGDDSALRAVLAPGFVDHVDRPTDEPDGEELIRYVAYLRETHQSLRLVPEEVIARGDRAVVRMSAGAEPGGDILGIPLDGADPWPRVDIVRVQEDRIVERWGDPEGNVSSTALFSETATLDLAGDFIPILQRLTYAPGATDQTFTQRGPAVIVVESGTLEVDLGPERNEGSNERAGLTHSGRSLTIAPGNVVAIQDAVSIATTNRTDAPAVALLFRLIRPRHDYARSSEVEPSGSVAGISRQDLAGYNSVMSYRDRITAELVRVTLPPGARLSHHLVSPLELLVVESGTLTVTIGEQPVHAWVLGQDGKLSIPPPLVEIAAGSGVTVAESAATAYDNQSSQPVTVLLLSLVASDTSDVR